MEPYRNSREHLFEELSRLDLLLNLQAVRVRGDPARGHFDQFRGLFIAEDDIDAILGIQAVPATRPEAEMQRLAGRIRQVEERISGRTAESLAQGVPLALVRLAQLFQLTPFDLDTFLICLAPELDLKYGKLYAYLQDDATRRSAGADLVLNLLCGSAPERIEGRRHLSAGAPLLRHGLIAEAGSTYAGGSLSRGFAVDAGVLNWLLEIDDMDEQLRAFVRRILPRASLDEAILQECIKVDFARNFLARAGGDSGLPALVLHGRAGAGRKHFAEALCRALGMGLLVADARLMAALGAGFGSAVRRLLREGALRCCAVYMDHAEALPAGVERARIRQALEEYRVVAFFGSETPWDAADEFPQLEIPVPGCELRQMLWQRFLKQAGHAVPPPQELGALADKFGFNPGTILAAIGEAGRIAGMRVDRQAVGLNDLYAACRLRSRSGLASLARKITPLFAWSDIILPSDQLAQLREICVHVQHRHQVFGGWGFDRKLSLGKGLNILFAGPSGTGKTMAAEIMAGELGLDLYKIDLSSVVSKYIGETEKNLKAVFQEAEQSNAILFFDEADAIFGKRSEVKDSHDRYANIEVNYLLQKMEEYSGTVILASNLRKNIDEAFLRRLRFVVEFPFPEQEYRYRIWKGVFPKSTPLDGDIDFRFLAERLKVPGGAIRNIALQAAFLAAADGGFVGMEQIMRSARREFQKMGRMCVKADFGPYLDMAAGVA